MTVERVRRWHWTGAVVRTRRLTMLLLTLYITSIAVLTVGCLTPRVRLENAHRLIGHPEFKQAAQAAPEWTREALKTINRLEYELERR